MAMPTDKFAFWGGESVRLLRPIPELGITTENIGVVWGVYDDSPPLYEATFHTDDGKEVDVDFRTDDVALADQSAGVSDTPPSQSG